MCKSKRDLGKAIGSAELANSNWMLCLCEHCMQARSPLVFVLCSLHQAAWHNPGVGS